MVQLGGSLGLLDSFEKELMIYLNKKDLRGPLYSLFNVLGKKTNKKVLEIMFSGIKPTDSEIKNIMKVITSLENCWEN